MLKEKKKTLLNFLQKPRKKNSIFKKLMEMKLENQNN